ncbi:uncharacterized protein LOC9660116 isoform X2 [Selaginella moellendorffii]|uniref:uncharacterized protein LOC9659315 isoform X2 n=1 Tax=Selaginella moellendorffii TaxID=88036 RepID=UPI000D1C26BF|nr:uncharacterized protein LOC9659315 isoform X2 [Selaginella moellendorffii]XP_024539735.1 uncharacterized protein LOC9660116 isoform X2 [Selaginella moellendorffii]|eukprot:XP_024516165.1 uncharacterized protein LOC9659315 isoform X2 [Selaginella moellendorffii]
MSWRRWRWSNDGAGDALPTARQDAPDSQILDTQEQEALVDSFEKRDKYQNALWRGIFAAFAATCALFFFYSAHQQAVDPWSTYHAVFSGTLNSRQIVCGDLAEAMTCIAIVVGVLSSAKWHRHLLVASMMAGLFLSLFWISNLLRSQKLHFQFQMLWLPFGTPSLAAICLYVDNVLAGTAKDIQALRASMYHHKRS